MQSHFTKSLCKLAEDDHMVHLIVWSVSNVTGLSVELCWFYPMTLALQQPTIFILRTAEWTEDILTKWAKAMLRAPHVGTSWWKRSAHRLYSLWASMSWLAKCGRILDKSPTPFQSWQKWGGVFTSLPLTGEGWRNCEGVLTSLQPPGEGWRKCEGVFTSLRPPGWPDRACCGGGWCIRWWARGRCPTCRGHTANTAPPGCRESPPCCGTGAASLVPVETTGISLQALVSENAVTASMYACSAASAYLYSVHLLSLLNASNTLTHLCQVHPSAHLCLTHQLCLPTLTWYNQHICSPLPNTSTMSAYLSTLTWYICSPLPSTSTMSTHPDPVHLLTFT